MQWSVSSPSWHWANNISVQVGKGSGSSVSVVVTTKPTFVKMLPALSGAPVHRKKVSGRTQIDLWAGCGRSCWPVWWSARPSAPSAGTGTTPCWVTPASTRWWRQCACVTTPPTPSHTSSASSCGRGAGPACSPPGTPTSTPAPPPPTARAPGSTAPRSSGEGGRGTWWELRDCLSCFQSSFSAEKYQNISLNSNS